MFWITRQIVSIKFSRLLSAAVLAGLLLACRQQATESLPAATSPPLATTTAASGPTAPINTPIAAPATPTAIATTGATKSAPLPNTNTPTASSDSATTAPLPTATVPPVSPTDAPLTAANSITLLPITSDGLTSPVYLTHAFDARLFVVEQAGRIRIIENGTLLDQPFLNIVDRVGSSGNEQGLLSVAFHPNYRANGLLYVNYTNRNGDTTISRFQAAGNSADAGSEQIVLTIPQPFQNHNGGQLQFGADGYLYVGVGDGGSANDPEGNGQNAATLLGTILRLDINSGNSPYAIPANNPFVNDDTIPNEIWSIGWRNPWRFSFDRATGGMFIADVGQNLWEEVHYEPPGASGRNYGWNVLEGSHCFQSSDCDTTGLQFPIFEFSHGPHCSITGGYMHRGTQFPQLNGNYFVGDFCSGFIWTLFADEDGRWQSQEVLRSGLLISSFGEDVDGELYVVDRNGTIWQIQP